MFGFNIISLVGQVILMALLMVLIVLPFITTWLSIRNITRPNKVLIAINDVIVLVAAPLITIFFGNEVLRISDNPWTEVNVNNALHAPIWPEAIPAFVTLIVLTILGYLLLTFVPLKKLPPLMLSTGISLLYIGIFLSITWTVQMSTLILNRGLIAYCLMCLMPWNFLLLCIRIIKQVINYWNENYSNYAYSNPLLQKLSSFIAKSIQLPLQALLLLIPILGIFIVVLVLFGQEPDTIIKMWTNTSDWLLSQKVSPPSVEYDEHYLCTVAASGHRKFVKPLRMGVRHGHRIVVNRQLLIANAFEQVLEEKIPRTHRFIRSIYDRYGFPLSRLIKKPWQADIVYVIMKPLEWFFLAVLYFVDVNPENRIALQYFKKPTE